MICVLVGGLVVALKVVVVWKMLFSCLLWCFWREHNDKSFEDRKRTLAELSPYFFSTLYIWTSAFLACFVLSLISLLFFLFLARCFSCVLLPGLRFSLSMIFRSLIKKILYVHFVRLHI
jgi:hypothetical protein